MIRLLTLRATPLVLRPMAVLLEGVLIADGFVLVLVLPIALMTLTISSLPVHLEYFRARRTSERLAVDYVAAITWLSVVSIGILPIVLSIAPISMEAVLIVATCFTFLVEKLADETSRALEFRKQFVNWFLIQLLRSGWLFVPLLGSVVGLEYSSSYLATSMVAAMAMLFVFWCVTGLRPSLRWTGIPLISKNAVFLIGSVIPASYRQLPRIVVAKVFPDQAHVFIAVSQLAQGAGLIFNVRFQIPYRKVIARRTQLFQKRLQPVMRRILAPVLAVAAVYFLVPVFLSPEPLSQFSLALFLVPITIADTLAFSILSAHLGYIPWFCSKRNALKTYAFCIAIATVLVSALMYVGWPGNTSVLSVPSVTILVGVVFLSVISRNHFQGTAHGG